jgi:hypothetical protein
MSVISSDHDLLVRIDERVTALIQNQRTDTSAQNVRLDVLDARLKSVEDVANRSKWAFVVVIAIGGLLSWFAGMWQSIGHIFGGR